MGSSPGREAAQDGKQPRQEAAQDRKEPGRETGSRQPKTGSGLEREADKNGKQIGHSRRMQTFPGASEHENFKTQETFVTTIRLDQRKSTTCKREPIRLKTGQKMEDQVEVKTILRK